MSGVGVGIAVASGDWEGTREGRCAGSVLFIEPGCGYTGVIIGVDPQSCI